MLQSLDYGGLGETSLKAVWLNLVFSVAIFLLTDKVSGVFLISHSLDPIHSTEYLLSSQPIDTAVSKSNHRRKF